MNRVFQVSLNVENSDGIYSPITVGDKVTVYYNGDIAESNPLQINTVYAVLLIEPADRTVNEIEDDKSEPSITITADGNSIAPYLHFAYSAEWDGEGFLHADGSDITYELRSLAIDGQIPQLVYAEDFNITLGSNVEMRYSFLYDDKYKQLDNDWDISKITELDAGEYYIAIIINEHGAYIEEAGECEYTGYACVFNLTIYE